MRSDRSVDQQQTVAARLNALLRVSYCLEVICTPETMVPLVPTTLLGRRFSRGGTSDPHPPPLQLWFKILSCHIFLVVKYVHIFILSAYLQIYSKAHRGVVRSAV